MLTNYVTLSYKIMKLEYLSIAAVLGSKIFRFWLRLQLREVSARSTLLYRL